MRLEPLVTADEIRAAERAHPGYPQSMAELMERAGTAVARVVLDRFPGRVAVVCGTGSNGGDGRVAERVLRDAGREIVELPDAEVVVDALFGTGFHDAPRDEAARRIEAINAAGVPVVAIDVPSGVNGSTGEVPGTAVRATVTVTFEARKVGLAVAPGRAHAGEVVVAPIGLALAGPRNALVSRELVEAVPLKQGDTTKYRAGSVLVVGGSPGMTGALCLCAEAAFRADAGYVTVACDPDAIPIVETQLREAVKRPLAEVDAALEKASALAIGPGLGRNRGDLVRRLLASDRPAVVDADGLVGLEPLDRAAPTVLTPHSGELGRLLDRDSAWVDAHRLEAVTEAAERFRCVVLLKGSDTLVAAPGEGVLVAPFGVAALATAGTGDVLTGIVAAFLAKGMEPRLAAAAGAVVHGLAARNRVPQAGLMAHDLLEEIPRVLGVPPCPAPS
jgi:NAD(P)H-hydrate epimerase